MSKRLSKSRYVMGRQCTKRLWRNAHAPSQTQVDAALQYRFDEGRWVGELATGLPGLCGGVRIEDGHERLDEALASTARAIEAGAETLYEATFLASEVLVRVDILARDADDRDAWHLYEVKAGGSVADIYLDDVAIQRWVLEQAGLRVASASLIHVNTGYVRRGDLDLQELFVIADLDEDLAHSAGPVAARVAEYLALLRGDSEPEVPIGPHCRDPYICEHEHDCWKHLPPYSIFDLTRVGKKAWKLYDEGLREITDVPLDTLGSRNQRVQVELALHPEDERFDRAGVRDFLDGLEYPLYFFDFETAGPAIPPHDGLSPYQQSPFQYSCHRVDAPGAEAEHSGFLSSDGSDPRRAIVEAMIRDLGDSGSIVAWNKSFEGRILRKLAEQLPEHAGVLHSFVDRLADLADPFKDRLVANDAMRGSWSLKYVAPAVLGERGDYRDLSVAAGGDASLHYLLLAGAAGRSEGEEGHIPEAEQRKMVEAMLEYCEKDTENTVLIHRWLLDRTAEGPTRSA